MKISEILNEQATSSSQIEKHLTKYYNSIRNSHGDANTDHEKMSQQRAFSVFLTALDALKRGQYARNFTKFTAASLAPDFPIPSELNAEFKALVEKIESKKPEPKSKAKIGASPALMNYAKQVFDAAVGDDGFSTPFLQKIRND